MRERIETRVPRGQRRPIRGGVVTRLVLFVAVAALGCAGGGLFGGSRVVEPSMEDAPTLGFGDWTKDGLHCAEDVCERLYAVDVTEAGRMRAEVYAPLDPGGPDFAFVLLDAAGEEIARPVDDDARPRRIAVGAEPGRYWLRVSARGDNLAPLRYDVVAFLDPQPIAPRRHEGRPASPPPPPRATPPAPPPSATTAPPPETPTLEAGGIRAEVLDVEVEDGGDLFVLLDRGEPHGVRKGMRGDLRVGDEVIGHFSVVEVYRDGSRAHIEGDLQADVGIDTVAVIHP